MFPAVPDTPLTTSIDGGVLTVSGAVDEESTEALRQAIEESSGVSSEHPRADLEVDLSGVTFLPSVAIGVLVRAEQAFSADGANLVLAAKSGSLAHRVLTVSAMPFRSY